jgi:hypothetical protein
LAGIELRLPRWRLHCTVTGGLILTCKLTKSTQAKTANNGGFSLEVWADKLAGTHNFFRALSMMHESQLVVMRGAWSAYVTDSQTIGSSGHS